jgi:hypothetical protein
MKDPEQLTSNEVLRTFAKVRRASTGKAIGQCESAAMLGPSVD